VVSSMFGTKMEQATGEWEKQLNKNIHNLCFYLGYNVTVNKMGETSSTSVRKNFSLKTYK
jgi:hypothetical protein